MDDGLISASPKKVVNRVLRKLKSNLDFTNEDGTYYMGRNCSSTKNKINIYIPIILHKAFSYVRHDRRRNSSKFRHVLVFIIKKYREAHSDNVPYKQAISNLMFLAT